MYTFHRRLIDSFYSLLPSAPPEEALVTAVQQPPTPQPSAPPAAEVESLSAVPLPPVIRFGIGDAIFGFTRNLLELPRNKSSVFGKAVVASQTEENPAVWLEGNPSLFREYIEPYMRYGTLPALPPEGDQMYEALSMMATLGFSDLLELLENQARARVLESLASPQLVTEVAKPHQESVAPIPIRLQTLVAGKILSLKLKPTDTILDLKLAYQDLEGIPPSQTRILYQGKEPADHVTLSEAEIKADALVHAVIKLRGD